VRAAPVALAPARRLVDLGGPMAPDAGIAFELETVAMLFATEDRAEGVAHLSKSGRHTSGVADMDVRYPPAADAYRAQVRVFLAEQLPPGWQGIGALEGEAASRFVDSWRQSLQEHDYLGVSWPTEYGGAGLTALEQVVLAEELSKARVPSGGPHDRFGIKMLGNTLIQWGTEEQKQRFLPRILSGDDRWCQGFSEPDAGSDLGSLACRAVLDGGEWVITGQKTWTSLGHVANWIFLLCRTDPAAPKHKGISFLLCPLDQPGIEIRPIRMMSGEREFNEVFFTEARTSVDNVVGEVNGGWAVAMTLLGYERGEAAATFPILFREELDRLLALARQFDRQSDPVVRQRLARCYAEVEIMQWLGYRTLTRFLQGLHPGAESSISKLQWSEYHRRATELAMDIMGLHGLVPSGRPPSTTFRTDAPGSPNSTASWAGKFLHARAGTLYAGSSEIQRNILGEMVLGLPREPQAG
jgi:alkylation response protein AidB-like acyl-CoA dehydrogenase